ncbi:unnamed protein product [Cylicostephanus goldi]|uniref:Major facilitator superfamily (MFS) profile domain-containing protein n=1 Tax=Cylicostephanus goldi TaxID=71465 RepID=A0A3P6QBN7_CYLGO|nr:unnamed protein product [Cylicostephanus goldi]
MVARFGSGVSSYIALLSINSLPIMPMIIFAIFSLFAGMLVSVLPETSEKPLPETLDVSRSQFVYNHQKACYGWGISGPHTRSISLHEQPSAADDLVQEKDEKVDVIGTGFVDRPDNQFPISNNFFQTETISSRKSASYGVTTHHQFAKKRMRLFL